MSEISKEIGKQIRSFRKRRGMTLDDLSRIICKSKSTISKYEKGEIPLDVETLYEIAGALQIYVEQLLYCLPGRTAISAGTDSPAFFAGCSQFYSYLFDGRNGQLIRCGEVPLENALIAFGSSPYYRERAEVTFAAVQEVFLLCGDVRRSGSAALDLCYVAAGRSDGFFEAILSPWDFCAASVILEEAGARAGSLEGPLGYEKGMAVIAGSPAVFDTLAEIARRHFARL